jgi:hypothetical protein
VKRRRHGRALRRRYGRSSGTFRWSEPRRGVQHLLGVRGDVIVAAYPHFVEASVAPPSGTMSAEMSFPATQAEKAKTWAEDQARRLGLTEAA